MQLILLSCDLDRYGTPDLANYLTYLRLLWCPLVAIVIMAGAKQTVMWESIRAQIEAGWGGGSMGQTNKISDQKTSVCVLFENRSKGQDFFNLTDQTELRHVQRHVNNRRWRNVWI